LQWAVATASFSIEESALCAAAMFEHLVVEIALLGGDGGRQAGRPGADLTTSRTDTSADFQGSGARLIP
jgi:hypothetical protein